MAALLPSMQGLTERQQQLYFLFETVIASTQSDELTRLVDGDVAEGAAAAAATLETAARGLIYEHSPQSIPAQKLASGLLALLGRVREQGATVYDREAAAVLRSIERGAVETRTRVASDGDPATAYLSVVKRLLLVGPRAASQATEAAAPGTGSLTGL